MGQLRAALREPDILRGATLGVIRALGVYIEVDDLDAALRLGMAGTGTPRSVAELDGADLCQPEATPFAFGWQARSALTAELIGEDLLLLLGVAEDDRTELARMAVVHADDLPACAHGLFEQKVIGTSHYDSPALDQRM